MSERSRSLPRRLSRDLTSAANRKSTNRRACEIAKVMRQRSETLKCAEKNCKHVRFSKYCTAHMIEKEDQCRPFPVPDKASSVCQNAACSDTFTFLNRRHHCRRCGLLFCGKCTNQSIQIPSLKYNAPVRVCDVCFEYEKLLSECNLHSRFAMKGGRLHKFMRGMAKNVTHNVKDSLKTSFKTLFKNFRDQSSTTISNTSTDSKETVGHDVKVWLEIDPYPPNSRICWKNFISSSQENTTISESTNSSDMTTSKTSNAVTAAASFLKSASKTRMSTVRHKMRLLRDVKAITKGLETQTLKAQFADTNKSSLLLFSLIFEDRSIDFQSYGEKEYEAWINGLRHAVAYSKLSPSSHPYTMRAKILNPALSAEMMYNSDKARKAREREQEYQSVVLSAREKFERRQRERQERLKQLRAWKTKK
eukprot:g7354.t1